MTSDELIGQELCHYKITEKLGEGGMGVVYRAIDTRLERTVALKILPAAKVADLGRKRRFVQEAKLASSLNHPNIVTIYDIGAVGAIDYIAMEYISGSTLHGEIASGMLTLKQALQYAIQVADALGAAHAAGIVHRDLKPGNIMVTGNGLVKILDFGLAKLTDIHKIVPVSNQTSVASTVLFHDMLARTFEGTIVGTAAYMSPEQAQGKIIDARSDIFSFGTVLYEMITGRRPFEGQSVISTLADIINKEPVPISEIVGAPPELKRIILRCLRKEPERRFQHMDDLKIALEELRDELVAGRFISSILRPSGELHTGAGSEPVNPRSATGAATGVPATSLRPPAMRWIGAGLALAAGVAVAGIWLWTHSPTTVRRPVLTRLTRDSGLSAYPALSPDGKFVAFASDRSGEGNLDIWVQLIGAGEPIRLTSDKADEYEPVYSPDGTKIAFRSERDGGGIYTIPALGGAARFVAKQGRRPRFSPRGNEILYWVGGDFGKMYVVNPASGTARPVQPNFYIARHPIWSPDGQHILFSGIRDRQARRATSDWWVTPVSGGAEAIKTGAFDVFKEHEIFRPVGSDGFTPGAWSGDEVVFSGMMGDTTNLWKVPISPKSFQVSGTPERLTMGTGLELQPSVATGTGGRGEHWSQIAFATLTRNIDLWSVRVDPREGKILGDPGRITNDVTPKAQATLSADGSKLVFLSFRSGNNDVWFKDLDTGKETALTATPDSERNPIFRGEGYTVMYSVAPVEGKSTTYAISVRPDGQVDLPEKMCENCGSILSWFSDGSRLLYEMDQPPPARARLLDLRSDASVDLIRHPEYSVWGASLSPDERWVLFNVTSSPVQSRIYMAPVPEKPIAPVPIQDWIALADGESWDDKPRWYPDGQAVYFVSTRDGFRCIWRQRIDARTKRPLGNPMPVYHLHSARLSMMNVDIAPLSLSVAHNRIVFSLGELVGNVWLAKFE